MHKIQQYEAVHDPDTDTDYGRNWGDSADGTIGYLLPEEVILSSEWIITADKETVPTLIPSLQGSGISVSQKMTSIFLTGGTPGVTYKLSNKIITLFDQTNRTIKKSGLLHCCRG